MLPRAVPTSLALILPWAGGILSLAATIWAVVDAVRNGRYIWIWIILLLPPFGAAAYLLVERGDLIGGAADRWLRLGERRRIRDLRAQIELLDAPHHHAALGDALLQIGQPKEAIPSFERALEGDPEDLDARAHLGYALRRAGRHEEAEHALREVVEQRPEQDYGRALLEWGHALRELGRRDEALAAYDRLLEAFTYSEGRYARAVLLAEQGQRDRAREEMERIVREARSLPKFARARELPWIRRARIFLAKPG